MKINQKAFSLIEILTVFSIISILILIIVQIILLYSKFSRESDFLTSNAIKIKEIATKIEKEFILSSNIKKFDTQDINNDGIIDVDKIETEKYVVGLYREVTNINGKLKKRIEIHRNGITIKKYIDKEIYWQLDNFKIASNHIYYLAFYLYNKYSEKYRKIVTRKLVYNMIVKRTIF